MNICLSISEINWSITKDIVSILGTLGALVIGYLGLLTWKKQLKGTHYFDLSKRTLILLYKYRAAIKSVRQPFYLPNETRTEHCEHQLSLFERHCNAYNYRWQQVNSVRNLLDAELLECSAIWDDLPTQVINQLYESEATLTSCTRHHLEHLDPQSSLDVVKYALENRDVNVLYETKGANEFSENLNTLVNRLEVYFKGKLAK
ncbi:hypothetical protein [Vibrio splendidus]|uniref:hypothetical protein n=1 Tax=Vibrio splendidus TaxID=29497 RepID=UPI000CAEABEE|nr:hypothetical protein [Vibrio splendidus]PMH14396.1 hypothetical protein BCU77_03525 [Vibrio splendidus]PTP67932.1 hypothetical protein CWO31_05745 [Vibrio splendidus]